MTKAATVKKRSVSHIQRKLIPSYIFLTIMSLLSVFPLYWMFTAATNTSLEVAQGKIWFGNYLAENYRNLIDPQNLWQAMGNSFFYAIVQTVATLFICSLAGYGFELYHDRGKDRLFAILLLAMMVPQVATLIPLFTMISKMKMLNTVLAFIIPGRATPFMIMMFRQNSRNFPMDTMEAARIDGLSEIGIFFRMYLPMMRATYAASAVIVFMNAWNASMMPGMSRPSGVAQGVCGTDCSMFVCSSRVRYRPMISAYIRFADTSAPRSSRNSPKSRTKR